MKATKHLSFRLPMDIYKLIVKEMADTSDSVSEILNRRLRLGYFDKELIEIENKRFKTFLKYNEERMKIIEKRDRDKKDLDDDEVDLVV